MVVICLHIYINVLNTGTLYGNGGVIFSSAVDLGFKKTRISHDSLFGSDVKEFIRKGESVDNIVLTVFQ
jgi:hypothetical protein